MRLLWVSPFGQTSAVGRFSMGVTQALEARGIEIVRWASDAPPYVTSTTPVPTMPSSEEARRAGAAHSLVVYNLGNHLGAHEGAFAMAAQVPGVVVLHDYVLHHAAAGWYLERFRDPEAYHAALRNAHPEQAEAYPETEKLVQSRLWESPELARFPFTSFGTGGARTAICHSRFHAAALGAVWPGPIHVLPLAYELTGELPAPAGPSRKPRLLATGHQQPNRDTEALIAALGKLRPVELTLVGPIGETRKRELEALAAKRAPQATLTFTGWVEDEELLRHLAAADLCINLRRPVTEGASATMIEQMWAGKPVVVYRDGFFGELPENTVIAASPDSLGAILAAALSAPGRLQQTGRAARAFAERYCRYAAYARSMESLLAAIPNESHGEPLAGSPGGLRIAARRVGNLFRRLLPDGTK